jgi:hypothetical protein
MAEDTSKEFGKLKEQAELYLIELPDRYKKAFNSLLSTLSESSEDALDQLRVFVGGIEKEYTKLDTTAESIFTNLKKVSQELGKDPAKELVKEFDKVLKISRSLRDNETGVTNLSKGQLYNKKALLESSVRELRQLAQQKEIQQAIENSTKLSADAKEELKAFVEEENRLIKEGNEEYASRKGLLGASINEIDKQILQSSKFNSALGLTGAFLDNVNKIGVRAFGGIGINLGILGEGLEKAKTDADKLALSMAKGEETFSRMGVLKAALPGIGEGVTGALTDPLTTIVALSSTIVKNFRLFNEASVEFSRQTGQAADGTIIINSNLVSGAEVLKFMSESSKILGRNIQSVFSKETITSAAEFQKMIGLSAEEATGLAKITEVTGTNIDANLEKVGNTVARFNATNRSALNVRDVLKQVGSISDGISAAFGGSVEKLTEAASQASRLGLELKELDSIASSLLDFESSIEAELEAQLLTGKALNLTKAREYALTNELGKLGEELFQNSVSLNEYSKLNRIQQEGYAKALGMSRDQLARTAYLRALELGMTQEQAAAAANVSAEEMKRLTVQESIATSVAKLGEAFAPVLDMVARFASTGTGLVVTMLAIAGIVGVKLYLGYRAVVKEMREASMYAEQMKNATIQTAIASQAIKPTFPGAAFPGASVGRGAGGRFTSLRAAAASGAARGVMFGPKGIAIATGLALGAYALSRVTSTEDGAIDPNGGLIVSSPKGDMQPIQTDKGDYLLASTNKPTSGGNINNPEVLRVLNRIATAVEQRQNIYLGPSKVSENLEVYA